MHQLHQLRVLDCEYGQGFLFSRPVPADKADELVKDSTEWTNILPSTNDVGQPEFKKETPVIRYETPAPNHESQTLNYETPTLEIGNIE